MGNYKPNRVGPWPLIDIDASLVAPTWSPGVGSSIECFFPAATDYAGQSAASFYDVSETLNNDALYGIGVKIDGSNLDQKPDALLSVAGSVNYAWSGEHLAGFFVGRTDDSLQTSTIAKWHLVPLVSAFEFTSTYHQLSTNFTLVLGDFGSVTSDDENPLAFGFFIRNRTGGAAAVSEFMGTLSIQRFEGNINIYDPTM